MRTMNRSRGLVVFGLVLALGVTACDSDDAVTNLEAEWLTISLSRPAAVITPNQSLQLGVKVANSKGDVHVVPLRWTSDSPAVASVDDHGMVWTHQAGVARISVALEAVPDHQAETAWVDLEVVQGVAFLDLVGPVPPVVYRGGALSLEARPRDEHGGLVARPMTWSSSDPSVATVTQEGVVTGIAPGMVLITVSADGRTASVTLTVLEPVASVQLTPSEQVLALGGSVTLTATPRCQAGVVLRDRNITWTSSRPDLVVVTDDGRAFGIAEGTATVTASSEGVQGTALITVRAGIGSVVVTPAQLDVLVGDLGSLSATVFETAGEPIARAVVWSSSDTSVVQVQDGVLVGRREGTATIMASVEGIVGIARVRVMERDVTIVLTTAAVSVETGETAQLVAVATGPDGEVVERDLVWSVGDAGVASVSDGGLLTGVAPGTTGVAARWMDREGRALVEVLPPQPAEIMLSPATAVLSVGETTTLSASAVDGRGNPLPGAVHFRSSDESVATVDDTGLVVAVDGGQANVFAQAGQLSRATRVTVIVGVTQVELEGPATLWVGDVQPFQAHLSGPGGQPARAVVHWTSSDPSIATVDQKGVVVARAPGTVVLTATSEGVSASIELVVMGAGSIATLVIVRTADEENEPIRVGGSEQLTAVAYDADGVEVPGVHTTWASSAEAVATVSEDGLVTGVAMGDVVITATARSVVGEISLRVVGSGEGGGGGGGEEGVGNNLSTPLVIAEGIGVTGLPVDEDTGLRPAAEEGIDVTVNPFWFDANQPDCGDAHPIYYCQQGPNTWRAEWIAAVPGEARSASVQWGDNLTHHTFNTHTPIRVEVRLYDLSLSMQGFNMPYVLGEGPDEIQGTDGTMLAMPPTIFAVTPRLTVQKLENYDEATGQGDVVATVFSGSVWEAFGSEGPGRFGAEVNVGGTVIYGYLLYIRDIVLPADIHKYGWWRLTFSMDDEGQVGGLAYPRNVGLTGLIMGEESAEGEELLYTPRLDSSTNTSWLDIYVESASGGGGGGGGHTGT